MSLVSGDQTHLQDIQDGQVDRRTSPGIVHRRPLDDDCMGWQVYTPCESGCTAKDL